MLTSLVVGAAGMNVLALALVLARGPAFGTRVYRPMLLNLALSVAPLVLLGLVAVVWAVLVRLDLRGVGWAVLAVGALAWLLLLPNAAYLITELNLSHRKPDEHVPMWFDTLLVLVLAMSGVLNTVLNVFVVQLEWVLVSSGEDATALADRSSVVLCVVILLLVALGIYLGRNVRLNSWDVRHPSSLVRKVVAHVRSPGGLTGMVFFTLLTALFLGLIYLVVIGPVIGGLVRIEELRG
ncbi:DUF1361 domain-containing protein [Cellulomonas palmilytica]|uniref:DUF1361 domain-containing protein n=1 Tax=Cellulomonas palmilytica TaxID=2608402 RepID=UPI001F28DA2E|nr:DUF1361 domain-containing protein [Cellulomonas palmilytica]UJP40057.1 DUF1361 domain-containing protein [Cellulomonas palmilytica]